ncbi:hypothetical protein GCM10011416_24220 [Polaribacter pacificus]|uniref:Uncharacterized protein n=3 Tax=root TaxID=1 RepID=A0A917MEV8_9FLAO|nr:hypothetical protein [Klebsiella phage KL01]GGH04298.1 hypothetical protein GCM10011416_24220 [Polaribacter pacificus]GGH32515.1 hypothetical protein GCM10011418_46080 [Sphingobacterium alkalisoli]GGK89731.1 hypothetical protein GCM10011405_41790 [Rufibacter glacialis]
MGVTSYHTGNFLVHHLLVSEVIMLAIPTLLAVLLALTIVFGLSAIHFHKAKKLYNVTRKGENWVVRDNKGRFVRITNNYWDVCKLGIE